MSEDKDRADNSQNETHAHRPCPYVSTLPPSPWPRPDAEDLVLEIKQAVVHKKKTRTKHHCVRRIEITATIHGCQYGWKQVGTGEPDRCRLFVPPRLEAQVTPPRSRCPAPSHCQCYLLEGVPDLSNINLTAFSASLHQRSETLCTGSLQLVLRTRVSGTGICRRSGFTLEALRRKLRRKFGGNLGSE